jgi:hypothetical protein
VKTCFAPAAQDVYRYERIAMVSLNERNPLEERMQ